MHYHINDMSHNYSSWGGIEAHSRLVTLTKVKKGKT